MYPNTHKSPEEQLFDAIVAHMDAKACELLDGGVNPNTPRHFGHSYLVQAATVGTDAMVRALIEHGADPNLVDDEGDTPLGCAAWENRDSTLSLLLSMGADPEKTPGGVEQLIEWVEDRGPDCRDALAAYLAERQGARLDQDTLQAPATRGTLRI